MNCSHVKSSERIATPSFWILPYFLRFLGLAVYEIDLKDLFPVYNLLYFP